MAKRLQMIGDSAGIIVDKPILELLGITSETDLDLSTDGGRLIVTPLATATRRRRIAEVQRQVLRDHEDTFRKLAK